MCLYESQNLGDILKSPVSRVIALNNAAIKKAQLVLERRQAEASEEQFFLAEQESKKDDKKHKEIIDALRDLSGGGLFDTNGGLLDGLFDGDGRNKNKNSRTSRNRRNRTRTSGRTSFAQKIGNAGRGIGRGIGRGVGALAGTLGLGGLLSAMPSFRFSEPPLPSASASSTRASSATASSRIARETAGEVAGSRGTLKGIGKLGTKVAGNAVKAIPVIGQILAVGMAAYDATEGWNNKELHQEAFDLKEGEEANTGQKIASATANMLDMGGLITGLASWVTGLEVSTADMANVFYGAGELVSSFGSGIASFFGFGEEEETKKEIKLAENTEKQALEKDLTLRQNKEVQGTESADNTQKLAKIATSLAPKLHVQDSENSIDKNNIQNTAQIVTNLTTNTAQARSEEKENALTKSLKVKEISTVTKEEKEKEINSLYKQEELSLFLGEVQVIFKGLLEGLEDITSSLKEDKNPFSRFNLNILGSGSSSHALNYSSYNSSASYSSPTSQTSSSSAITSSPTIDNSQANVEHIQRISAATENKEVHQAVLAGASESLMAGTQKAIDNKVSYKMGGKSSAKGEIDCSGWVSEQSSLLMQSVNTALGEEVFSQNVQETLKKGHLHGGAAGIIKAGESLTGQELGNAQLTPEQVKEGMMIGITGGDHARGRHKDIGHIVQTYRDPETGQMMVSESTSNRRGQEGKSTGVRKMSYEEWWGLNKQKQLHGVDLMSLADVSKVPAQVPTHDSLLAGTSLSAMENSSNTTQNEINHKTNHTEAQAVYSTETRSTQEISTIQASAEKVKAKPLVRKPETQGVSQIMPPQAMQNTLSNSAIESLLAKLISVVEKSSTNTKDKHETKGSESGPPHIALDFGDSYSYNIAHDIA